MQTIESYGLGTHFICSMSGIEESRLNDSAGITSLLTDVCEQMGVTVLNRFSHDFEPHGVTVLFALAESHISIHTFPEKQSLAADAYTCGDNDPLIILNALIEWFKPLAHSYQGFLR
jgi:S-adenosylmethionine decarboxylase